MTLARLGRDPALATVLVLDLDRFREVAERFGDDAVDRLLVAVAGRLRSILRPSDTVSRFGSDEFAVLCPDLAHERDAVRLAERMTAGLATQYLPLSSLKIDRSFVERLDLDPEDDAMVAAIIGLGHTLGLTVIAEGVETPASWAKLDQLGCGYAQGYLFARPETASRVGVLLGHDRRWQ